MTSDAATQLLVVTPAHNESDMLPTLAESIRNQTLAPALWVIVDDRSTDTTTETAQEISSNTHFADTIRRDNTNTTRTFSGKVDAFAEGLDFGLAQLDSPDFIACVDADVILPPDYFERVVAEFQADPDLGVSGGVYLDPVGRVGRHGGGSVPGPAQVFRKETFDQIGGFRPLELGGEDALACAYARMHGWSTRALPELEFRHTRRMGSDGGGRSPVSAAFKHGRQDWHVGVDPLFEVFRMLPRLKDKPYVVGVLARLAGFAKGAVTEDRMVDADILAYVQAEQRARILAPLRRIRG